MTDPKLTPPLADVIEAAIYKARWVDNFGKEPVLATDEAIARAVLDALTKAGGMEWGVFRITDAPVTRPFDEAKFTTKEAAEVFIKLGFLERVAKTLEPRRRFTGTWERAE